MQTAAIRHVQNVTPSSAGFMPAPQVVTELSCLTEFAINRNYLYNTHSGSAK